MNTSKTKLGILVLVVFTILSMTSVAFAVNRIFNLSASYDGTAIVDGATYTAVAGKKITVTVNPTYVDDTLKIAHVWGSEALKVDATGTKTATITVPQGAAGTKVLVQFEALIKDNAHNYVGNSNVVKCYFQYPDAATTVDVNVYDGSKKLTPDTPYEIKPGSKLKITVTTNKAFKALRYLWEGGDYQDSTTNNIEITVPNMAEGTQKTLKVRGAANDNTTSALKNYIIKAPVETVKETITKKNDTTVTIKATVANGTFQKHVYNWDGGSNVTSTASSVDVAIPTTEGKHTLTSIAYTASGKTNKATYTVEVAATTIEAFLKVDGTVKEHLSTITVNSNTKLVLYGTSNKTVTIVSYKWENENKVEKDGSSYTIPVPSNLPTAGLKLYITAKASDGKWANSKTFTVVPQATVKATINETITKKNNTTVTIKATVSNGTFQKHVYNWDGGSNVTSTTNPVDVTIPTAVGKHTLTSTAYATDGTTSKATYTVEVKEEKVILSFIKEGKNAEVTAIVENGNFKKFVYNWDGAANQESTVNPMTTPLPTSVGRHVLTVTAYSANGKTQTGTLIHNVEGQAPVETLSLSLVKDGSNAKATATVANGTFQKFVYNWDGAANKETSYNPMTVALPTSVGTHTLTVTAYTVSGLSKKATLTYTVEAKPVETLSLSLVRSGNNAKATATVENGTFQKFVYNWDGAVNKESTSNPMTVALPTSVGTHTLTVTAYTVSGISKKGTLTYTVEADPEPDEGGELIVPEWMIENEDAEGLIVSLRNDSDEEKANKNFYQVGEEVIYYVDYLNAGKEITNEVKLVLNLPLNFTVVDADGGSVNTNNKTITWTYPYGLVENAADTKVVKIKYTALSKKSYSSEIVYPQAVIYKQAKAQDYSAVINCIYLDSDTEFDDTHVPYMYGDLEAPTFRPDEGISRAEGAMVLLRIFGEDYLRVKTITKKYSDIDETYYVAQQAITKATQLGIMSGYPDGTFKPNDKMTRAEFMRVIASYIEESADVEGLEVKDESAVMVYYNKRKTNHWAVPYVTLLARLNMTSVSDDELDLRVDDTITRAEVAQLCNFFLFRAPAKVTSSTRIDFEDVSRNHKLIGDIVEATRAEHEYVITDEIKEKAR